ncbi:MAG: hypothetical protein ACPG5T_00275 [Endozoicomonas sp.]
MNVLKKTRLLWGRLSCFYCCTFLFLVLVGSAVASSVDHDIEKIIEIEKQSITLLELLKKRFETDDLDQGVTLGGRHNASSTVAPLAPEAITESDIKTGTVFDCYGDRCECGVHYCSSTEYQCNHGFTSRGLLERLNQDYERQNYDRNYEKCVNHKPGKAIKGYDAGELSGLCLKGYFEGMREGLKYKASFNLRVENHQDRGSEHRYDLVMADQPVHTDNTGAGRNGSGTGHSVVSVDGMKLKALGEGFVSDRKVHYLLKFQGTGNIGVRNKEGDTEDVFFRGAEKNVRLYSVFPDDLIPIAQDIFTTKLEHYNGSEYRARIRKCLPVFYLAVIEQVVECREAFGESEQSEE